MCPLHILGSPKTLLQMLQICISMGLWRFHILLAWRISVVSGLCGYLRLRKILKNRPNMRNIKSIPRVTSSTNLWKVWRRFWDRKSWMEIHTARMVCYCGYCGLWYIFGIWWYAFTRSIVVKTVQPARLWSKSCMCRIGYLSGIVRAFNLRWSPQGRQPLSFFGTKWRGELHELFDGLAVPLLSIASNSCLAIFNLSGAGRRGVQYTGGLSVVRMWCTVLWRGCCGTPCGRVISG